MNFLRIITPIFITLFVCILFLPVTPVYANFDLISHWNLDESSGTRFDSEGDNDLSSINNTPSISGYEGSAASFPLANSTYLTIADNESLSTTGDDTFKISLWVKLLAKTGTQVFVSKYDSSGQGEYAVYYEDFFKRFVFSTYSGGSGNHYVLANTLGEPQLDTWYFIEVTHDGENNTNTITINGEYTDTLTDVPSHQDTGAPFRIGAFGPTPSYFANASIDEVKFYKQAPSNLMAYWKFDEGEGLEAVDFSGNGYVGTINGATYSESVPLVNFDNFYSLNFDGIDDGVTTSLSLNNYPVFTLAGWAYPRTAQSGEGWFGANNVFEFFFINGSSVKCWTPQGETDWSFDPEAFLDNWHHITCIGDGNNIILYVDGEQVSSTPHPYTDNYGTGDNFSIGIGVQNGGTSGPFDGFIDDVRVYNTALSPAEMFSLGTGSEEPTNSPVISSLFPANNSVDVAIDADLSITFNMEVEMGSGDIVIKKTEDDTTVEVISASGENISGIGTDTIVINPENDFDYETSYYIEIPNSAIRDTENNQYFGGISGNLTWNFTTEEISIVTINDCEGLQTIQGGLDGDYVLENDIDCSVTHPAHENYIDFIPIGDSNDPFTGTFNGNGFTISNLYINSELDNVGLFGVVSGAEIRNLGLQKPRIAGTVTVGSIAGEILTESNIDQVYSISGFVSSINGCVGGIVGISYGIVSNSYARIQVTSPFISGGLVSCNGGEIINSYSTGKVSGSHAGGLVGDSCCEAITLNSFWNIETSDQELSHSGEGKISEEMKDINTYTTELGEDSWNFNEEGIWTMDEEKNDGYPYLLWQTSWPKANNFGVDVETKNATTITQNTATIYGNFAFPGLIPEDLLSAGGFIAFVYGTTDASILPPQGNLEEFFGELMILYPGFVIPEGNDETTFEQILLEEGLDLPGYVSELSCGTRYYYRAIGFYAPEIYFNDYTNLFFDAGEQESFETLPCHVQEDETHSNRSRKSGSSISTRIQNLLKTGNIETATKLQEQWSQESFTHTNVSIEKIIVRDLFVDMRGDDVRMLQQFLISQGYKIPAGVTGYFGSQTRAALSAYQQTNNIVPSAGYFGPITRTKMSILTPQNIWW